ncbi:MAG: TrbG/VirB9 family P-type conjugative transfer protein [Sneathiella sp.]
MRTLSFILAISTTIAVNSFAHAQTVMGNQGRNAPQTPNQVQAQAPQMPVSKKVIKQAKQQIDGNFSSLNRSAAGGQIQPVWDETEATEGFFQYKECTDCIYKVRVREFMVTTVILPKGIKIHSFDIGDPAQFTVQQRADNILAVQAAGGGIDSNLTIYTNEGEVFPFYLRSENFNSINVPDLVVRITGNRLPKVEVIKAAVPVEAPTAPDAKTSAQEKDAGNIAGTKKEAALAGLKKNAGTTQSHQGKLNSETTRSVRSARGAAFDADKLRGWDEYELWGDDELRPEMVFRDDHFTYIKFGDRWADVDLPTAYVVVDEIDELVNTRVQGTTFIIESTKKLITLKSGKKFLCIQYEGEA